jgi:leader peptidase (prepilin peptidase) / N-methyltransferase
VPSPLSIAFALAGLVLGLAADRLSTRWPAHDGDSPAGRAADWRTVVVGATGALAFGLLPARFEGDALATVVFGAWFALLIVGLATDLDQRLLPDVTTLPVIPIALIYAASGSNPFVGGELLPAIAAAVVIPAAIYIPSLAFGAGAFGLGDVKLLGGLGLMAGLWRALGGVFFGLTLAGVVLVVLLVARRIGRRSYVPFGPFLIIGALWAVLLRP